MTPFINIFKSGKIIYSALGLLALALPYIITSKYILHVIIMCYMYAIAIYGLNLIMGYTGQLSLAHAGFYGVGAYTAGVLTLKLKWSFWLALPAACIMASLVGILVGLISLRLKSHYFTIFSLCVGLIIYLIIEHWESVTEGVRGLIGVPPPNPIPLPGGGAIVFTDLTAQYYLVLLCLVFTIFVMNRIINSMVGRTFMAIRNSEELASTIGINVFANKLLSFVISAFFAGLAGALFAGYIRFLGPTMSHPNWTFEFLLMLLIGGQGTLAGPLVGSLLVNTVTESLQFMQSYRYVVFGPLLILSVMFFPRGMVGAYYSLKNRIQTYRSKKAAHQEALPVLTGNRKTKSEELRG
ncbi:MAG: branched-chain amino acid ABC transporter permease [Bacillota bacterium]